MHMHVADYLLQFAWPTVAIVALVVIGSVFGRRAGAAKGRMWLGLGLVMADQVLSAFLGVVISGVVSSAGYEVIGLISTLWGILTGGLLIAGIAVLASAIALGRTPGASYLDPNRPGAPPVTGYQGAGYPPAGRAGSPYVTGPTDGGPSA